MKTFLTKNLKDTLRTNCGVIQKLKDVKNAKGSKLKQIETDVNTVHKS